MSPRPPTAIDHAAPTGMCCPRCASIRYTSHEMERRKRRPVNWRRHQCLECGHVFTSEQHVVQDAMEPCGPAPRVDVAPPAKREASAWP